MAIYEVTARRTGDWWALEVPDVPGAFSQCKRLDQAPAMAKEAIALVLDVDEDTVDVDIRPELPAKAAKVVDRLQEARRQQEAAAREANNLQVHAIHDLVSNYQLSYRDVGNIVGLSHQRISQVVKSQSVNKAAKADPRKANA